jgi:ABC-type glycerol-3-phosphate transport system substrate-binding protein
MGRRLLRVASLLLPFLAAGMLGGCPAAQPTATPTTGANTSGPSGVVRLQFWHTRRGGQEKTLRSICDEFHRANPGVEIVPEYQGSYDDLNRKVRASIQGKRLPALTVAYESHVTEYMANGVVRALDDLVKDAQAGFSKEELADIPEQYVASNRFRQFNNQLLSFPFTKSNLVMYYNQSLLRKAGFQEPPKTWAEFEQQAAAVTTQTGKPAWVFDADPSTLDGMIYSQGGDVLAPEGARTLFDQPPAVKAFELLQRMAKAKQVTEVAGDDTGPLFANQNCAFLLGSSSGRTNLETLVGSKFEWDVAVIPHAEGVKPVTVMYGPNVCIFKSTPEQERAAWKFVKYFVSPPVTARWARESGYLPVRKSAVDLPEMKAFYEKNPRARHVYDVLPMAKGEPNVVGWQEVRKELETAARTVMGGRIAPSDAAGALKKKADQTLAQSR